MMLSTWIKYQTGCLMAFAVACLAWLTHVVYCLTTGKFLLLIAGSIAFPVGIIHGFGIWLGFWR